MKDFILQHINTTRKASFRNCFCYIALRRTTRQRDNETTDYGQRTTDNRLRTTDYGQRDNESTRQRDN